MDSEFPTLKSVSMYGAWCCQWSRVKPSVLATCPLLVVLIDASHYILARRTTWTVAVSFQSSVTHSLRTRLLIKCSGVRFTYDWIIHIVKAVHVAQTVSAADAWTTKQYSTCWYEPSRSYVSDNVVNCPHLRFDSV